MILVINLISLLNQLFFKDEVSAYGEKKEKMDTGGDYKVYSVYLVQDSVNYGNIEPEDQSYYFEQQNDYYGESYEQQRSLSKSIKFKMSKVYRHCRYRLY